MVSCLLEAGKSTVQNIEIPLARGSLEGQILYDGDAYHDAEFFDQQQVMLLSVGGDMRIQLEISMSDTGYYRAEHLPAGEWEVLVGSLNRGAQSASFARGRRFMMMRLRFSILTCTEVLDRCRAR